MASFSGMLSQRILGSTSTVSCRSCLLQSLRRKAPTFGYRHLYAGSAIGLDGYIHNREKAAVQFNENLQKKFRERMNEVLVSNKQNMIFTEDLKNAIHIADATEDDLSLVIKMAQKFNNQHSGLRFGSYIFGPVVMRMFHHLNQPDAALQALKLQELEGFFDQFSSYQIAMDLLYEHERHQEVLDAFRDLQEKRLSGVKYPKSCLTIALASCYKMNTNESYEAMMEIFEGANEHGTTISLRSLIFAAALAFRQNYSHICLEILSRASSVNHIVVRNLRVMALTELGRVDDTLPILRSVLQSDLPDTHLPGEGSKILQETIQRVEEAVKGTENKELISEFQHISKSLEENNFITEKTLDESVSHPIQPYKSNSPRHQDRAMLAASFNRNSRNQRPWQGSKQRRRPGLMDLD